MTDTPRTLQGTRMNSGKWSTWPAGAYGLWQDGDDEHVWVIRDPKGRLGMIRTHHVTEHEDGTITVFPSILDDRPDHTGYHGWLEHGMWREA